MYMNKKKIYLAKQSLKEIRGLNNEYSIVTVNSLNPRTLSFPRLGVWCGLRFVIYFELYLGMCVVNGRHAYRPPRYAQTSMHFPKSIVDIVT